MSDIDAKQLLQDLRELREELDQRATVCRNSAFHGDENFSRLLAKANTYEHASELLSSILESYGAT